MKFILIFTLLYIVVYVFCREVFYESFEAKNVKYTTEELQKAIVKIEESTKGKILQIFNVEKIPGIIQIEYMVSKGNVLNHKVTVIKIPIMEKSNYKIIKDELKTKSEYNASASLSFEDKRYKRLKNI